MTRVNALCTYMKARAAFEGVEWKLTHEYVQSYFERGCRNFFGVEINDRGELLSDEQQPAFFKSYQCS
jgi:hypothetical protein